MALEMKYFILKPKSKGINDQHAKASRAAMRIYAMMIYKTDPEMSRALREWADKESEIAECLKPFAITPKQEV